MTIIESIVQFLGQYEADRIGVEKLTSQSTAYSLMKAPQEHVEKFISGLEIHTDYYELMVRRHATSEAERISNNAWGQGIAEWISRKERTGDYPVLDGYVCTGLGISTPFALTSADSNSAVYQMTIKVVYRKEN